MSSPAARLEIRRILPGKTWKKTESLPPPKPLPHLPRRTTKKDARKDTRNAVLFPVDEDETVETGTSFLPARLAHLRGPIGATPPRDPQPASGNNVVNRFAPGTPGTAVAVPPGVTPTVNAGGGRVLMGPWNGEYARAGSVPSSTGAPPPSSRSDEVTNHHPSQTRSVIEVVADESTRENLSDLPFAGPEDMDMDEESVLREQWMEDAMTGRGGRDTTADEGDEPVSKSSVDERADNNDPNAAALRAVRGRAGRGRAASAPAAIARRVGAARVAARRRTPMAIQRKAKEALANARKESSRRAGDGPGFFHINGAMKRNNGPRNTAGVRCMQPRSGAF